MVDFKNSLALPREAQHVCISSVFRWFKTLPGSRAYFRVLYYFAYLNLGKEGPRESGQFQRTSDVI